MVNKNYIKGRRKEYKVCHKLKKSFGYDIAQRTAGSHSPFDIIAIKIKNKKIKLVQCKPDDLNNHQTQKIRDKNKELNGTFEVTFSVF